MFTLSNDQLTVHLLDPADPADVVHQGSRYCWGGYVWQVVDRKAGPLLSGPEYPAPHPDPFNGQGLPEAFRCRDQETLARLTLDGNRGLVVGAGEVILNELNEPVVVEPALWEVQITSRLASFTTEQRLLRWHVTLERTVSLDGRRLVSSTHLHNRGEAPLPLHWFPHPFFPLVKGRTRGLLSPEIAVPENDTFVGGNGVLRQQRIFPPGHPGHFQPLTPGDTAPWAEFVHPRLSGIRMSCSYVASAAPVWANANTFSFEPYLKTLLAPGEAKAWSVGYDFLPPLT